MIIAVWYNSSRYSETADMANDVSHHRKYSSTDMANDLQYKSIQSADRKEEKVYMVVKTCIVVFRVMCCLVGGY